MTKYMYTKKTKQKKTTIKQLQHSCIKSHGSDITSKHLILKYFKCRILTKSPILHRKYTDERKKLNPCNII